MAEPADETRPSTTPAVSPDETPGEISSASQSRSPSQSGMLAGGPRRERPRVRFTAGGEFLDSSNQRSTFDVRDDSWNSLDQAHRGISMPVVPTISSDDNLTPILDNNRRSASHSILLTHVSRSPPDRQQQPYPHIGRPPPSVMRPLPYATVHTADTAHIYDGPLESVASQLTAQDRAMRLSRHVGTSTPASVLTSPRYSQPPSPMTSGSSGPLIGVDDIPMIDLRHQQDRHVEDRDSESDEEESSSSHRRATNTSEAHHLVRIHTKSKGPKRSQRAHLRTPPPLSGQITPVADRDPDDYVAPPDKYRGGILATLLKLYNPSTSLDRYTPGESDPTPDASRHASHATTPRSTHSSLDVTPRTVGSSGTATPRTKHKKWYKNKTSSATQSNNSLAGLMESSAVLAMPAAGAGAGLGMDPTLDGRLRPHHNRARPSTSSSKVGAALQRMVRPRLEDEIRITVHIAETLSRQRYLVKLCRALMTYGAPTHRLEEYMKMTARVLEIDSQFLYIPGCMIISFDDADTHTTEVKLVRTSQGVDLGKLRDTHEIYKEVVHDVIGMEEATQRLDDIQRRRPKFTPWLLVLVYGFASACVGPFAFQARLVDLPLIFGLGSLLGILQLILAPKSDLYSNVFEISAAVLTSFLARAFGSIRGGNLFCFSALAQSSIALILPGYTVLCASLELQSKNIVAGSVRMVYAIIYSLFLGFGITIGTALYGLIEPSKATSATQCTHQLPPYYAFLFVPPFTLCLIIINQAKWKQAPVMVVIAFTGYCVTFFTSRRFPSNAQISNTLGAFVIGVLGNLYSRLHHGMAAAAILPAIFVQVPSGLAASGSLVSGVQSANRLTNSANGTAGTGYNTVSSGMDTTQLNTVVFNVGYSMIQVAIGITVGLFLSALVVYPFGKRRSGLFSF